MSSEAPRQGKISTLFELYEERNRLTTQLYDLRSELASARPEAWGPPTIFDRPDGPRSWFAVTEDLTTVEHQLGLVQRFITILETRRDEWVAAVSIALHNPHPTPAHYRAQRQAGNVQWFAELRISPHEIPVANPDVWRSHYARRLGDEFMDLSRVIDRPLVHSYQQTMQHPYRGFLFVTVYSLNQ